MDRACAPGFRPLLPRKIYLSNIFARGAPFSHSLRPQLQCGGRTYIPEKEVLRGARLAIHLSLYIPFFHSIFRAQKMNARERNSSLESRHFARFTTRFLVTQSLNLFHISYFTICYELLRFSVATWFVYLSVRGRCLSNSGNTVLLAFFNRLFHPWNNIWRRE